MAKPRQLSDEDRQRNVSEDVVGRLYRSNGREVDQILADFSEEQRARLALFCYGRVHMREIGLAVAATCELGSLIDVGGHAGQTLYMMARERPVSTAKPLTGRYQITLATTTGAPKPIEDIEDVEDDEAVPDRAFEIEAAARSAFEKEFAIAVA
jgi:hypothetical protein